MPIAIPPGEDWDIEPVFGDDANAWSRINAVDRREELTVIPDLDHDRVRPDVMRL
jgi:hypothetical protein